MPRSAHVAEMAERKNFQVWVERVDTTGKGAAIIMEDGEAREIAAAPAEAKKAKVKRG